MREWRELRSSSKREGLQLVLYGLAQWRALQWLSVGGLDSERGKFPGLLLLCDFYKCIKIPEPLTWKVDALDSNKKCVD